MPRHGAPATIEWGVSRYLVRDGPIRRGALAQAEVDRTRRKDVPCVQAVLKRPAFEAVVGRKAFVWVFRLKSCRGEVVRRRRPQRSAQQAAKPAIPVGLVVGAPMLHGIEDVLHTFRVEAGGPVAVRTVEGQGDGPRRRPHRSEGIPGDDMRSFEPVAEGDAERCDVADVGCFEDERALFQGNRRPEPSAFAVVDEVQSGLPDVRGEFRGLEDEPNAAAGDPARVTEAAAEDCVDRRHGGVPRCRKTVRGLRRAQARCHYA